MTMTAREFLERMEMAPEEIFPSPKCARCGEELREAITGNRHTADGWVDSDCYFDGLSEVVEQFPIRTARVRRG